MTVTDYRTLAIKYIRHKIILSVMCNYRKNQQFQRHVFRLKELLRWLNGGGKFLTQQRVFVVIKSYQPDFYGSLPHPDNKSYESCLSTLKEIFE
jgi:hypothetical protein